MMISSEALKGWRLSLLAIGLGLGLVLSGCSGSGGGGDATDASGSTQDSGQNSSGLQEEPQGSACPDGFMADVTAFYASAETTNDAEVVEASPKDLEPEELATVVTGACVYLVTGKVEGAGEVRQFGAVIPAGATTKDAVGAKLVEAGLELNASASSERGSQYLGRLDDGVQMITVTTVAAMGDGGGVAPPFFSAHFAPDDIIVMGGI